MAVYHCSSSGCKRVAFASERHDGVVVGRVEGVEAPQDVGGLPERQAEVGPVERDVREADQRATGRKLCAQPLRVDLHPRQRHAGLHAPLHLDKRELHVDGARQIRLIGFELFQLDDFARLGARWAGRTVGHVETL